MKNARPYLRKDNSCKNWPKRITFTLLNRRQIACCYKHRYIWKVKNTLNGDQLNLIQEIQLTFQCLTWTKYTRWKSSGLETQNLLITKSPENVSSIGQSWVLNIVDGGTDWCEKFLLNNATRQSNVRQKYGSRLKLRISVQLNSLN